VFGNKRRDKKETKVTMCHELAIDYHDSVEELLCKNTTTTGNVLPGSNPDLCFTPVVGSTSHWRASGLLAWRIKRSIMYLWV